MALAEDGALLARRQLLKGFNSVVATLAGRYLDACDVGVAVESLEQRFARILFWEA